jgi:Ser/Thr protein kinase RdoA (MazF antagonist)
MNNERREELAGTGLCSVLRAGGCLGMYSNICRDSEYLSRLARFLLEVYCIKAVDITPAKRGFYGETWRLDSTDKSYFVKLVYPDAYAAVYERSFHIIEHLCNNGIDFISKIIKTKDGGLFSRFDGAVLGVFEWINGKTIQTDATQIPEYQMLAKVYTIPANGLDIPSEDFSAKNADIFFEKWGLLVEKELISLFEKKRAELEYRAARLRRFSCLCQNDAKGFVITHGDAGGNLIKDGGRYFIVDWDNPILAPPERDAWVMCSRDWAREAFQSALFQNNIEYTIRNERLAYYCYQFFFFYLISYIDGFTQASGIQEIEAFIDGWIKDSFEYADKI